MEPIEPVPTRRALGMKCLAWLAGLLCGPAVQAQDVPPVVVTVSAQPTGTATVYHYTVRNHGTQPVTALQIGFDYDYGRAELRTAPAGATSPGPLPAAAASSPQGWAVALIATEDVPDLDLEWSADSPEHAVPPGASLVGFSVTVPGNDPSYVHAHWTVSLNGPGAAAYSAALGAEPARGGGGR